MKICCLALGILMPFCCCELAYGVTVFQIGNSFTWDSQPEGVRAMAESASLDWVGGYHVRSGSSIKTIYENPTPSNNLSLPGPTWEEALPGAEWDIMVVQPHNAQSSTLGEDVDYSLQFRSAAMSEGRNSDIQMYVYSTWAARDSNWSNWLSPVSNTLEQPALRQREYYEHVANRLTDEIVQPVHVIPAGDVLYRLKQEIEAGTVPNLTSWMTQLYRDPIHMSYGYGRFVAGTTVLSTIGRINPTGIAPAAGSYGNLNSQTVLRIQEIVWDVVANHPYSGVVPLPGDYNGDGLVDALDYSKWKNSFGATSLSYAADGNRDGVINISDYALWRDRYQTTPVATSNPAVPEPSSLILLGIAATALIGFCLPYRRYVSGRRHPSARD